MLYSLAVRIDRRYLTCVLETKSMSDQQDSPQAPLRRVDKMRNLMREMFPICRSITGNGVDKRSKSWVGTDSLTHA